MHWEVGQAKDLSALLYSQHYAKYINCVEKNSFANVEVLTSSKNG